MTRPYSLDLRKRVARFVVVSGGTTRQAAERFDISVATAVRWAKRLRETGSTAAYPMGGVRRAVLAGEREWLLARIKEQPDLTLRAIQAELAERSVVVSYDAVWRFLRPGGRDVQKKACAPPNRPGLTSPASGSAGSATRAALIRAAWSSSMRPGPRPT